MPKLHALACESTLQVSSLSKCVPIGSGGVYKGYWNGTLVAFRTLHYKELVPTPKVRSYCTHLVNGLNTSFFLPKTIEHVISVRPTFVPLH